MRLRKVTAQKGGLSLNVSFLGEGGFPTDVIGIVGGNLSGKTLLTRVILHTYVMSVAPLAHESSLLAMRGIDGSVEFEYSGITLGVIREGKMVQRAVIGSGLRENGLTGGLLVYDSVMRAHQTLTYPVGGNVTFGENLVLQVLRDLYKGIISNSVIVVDDFDLGLDFSGAREFLSILVRKSLETHNQLIVTTKHASLLNGIPSTAHRNLGDGTSLVGLSVKNLG